MFNIKKSQGAIEFLIILIFMLVLISGVIYIIGLYSIDLKHDERKAELDDFANSIILELNTFQKVEPGFHREVIIPDYLMKRYKVNVTYNWLILTDIDYNLINDTQGSYYYQMPGDLDINYSYDNNTGEAKLIFDKKSEIDTSGFYLG